MTAAWQLDFELSETISIIRYLYYGILSIESAHVHSSFYTNVRQCQEQKKTSQIAVMLKKKSKDNSNVAAVEHPFNIMYIVLSLICMFSDTEFKGKNWL